jgi:hypothetical protein
MIAPGWIYLDLLGQIRLLIWYKSTFSHVVPMIRSATTFNVVGNKMIALSPVVQFSGRAT